MFKFEPQSLFSVALFTLVVSGGCSAMYMYIITLFCVIMYVTDIDSSTTDDLIQSRFVNSNVAALEYEVQQNAATVP